MENLVIILVAILIFNLGFVSSYKLVSDKYEVDSNIITISGENFENYDGNSFFNPLMINAGEFEIQETTSQGGGGSGDGGGGEGQDCAVNEDCPVEMQCIDFICTLSFNTQISNVPTKINPGVFLNFTYTIEGATYAQGQVITDFWIEKSEDEKISVSRDTSLLNRGQNQTKNIQLYIPENITDGEYLLKSKSYYVEYPLVSKNEEAINIYSKKIDERIYKFTWALIILGISAILTYIILRYKKKISDFMYIISYNIIKFLKKLK